MKPIRWLISSVAVVGLMGAGAFGLAAHAEEAALGMAGFGGHGHGPDITAHVDAALDAGAVTPAERAAVHATLERAKTAMAGQRAAHQADVEQLLTLFTADKLDNKALAQLRASEEKLGETSATSITTALTEAHDTLSGDERQKIAAWVEAQAGRHSLKDHPHMVDFMKGRVVSHVDSMLDQAGVGQGARPQIEAAVENVLATFAADAGAHQAHLTQALALWQADRIDSAAVAKLRQDGVAQRKALGDSIAQAVYDIHDALTPTERKALVAQLREHLAHMRSKTEQRHG